VAKQWFVIQTASAFLRATITSSLYGVSSFSAISARRSLTAYDHSTSAGFAATATFNSGDI
jgi:presenilin-like A22 family membrane protease